jgi:hypothetical protein
VTPHAPVAIDITVRPTSSLTPAELDEIWVVTDRYVETARVVYEKKLKALPEVGLWRTRTGTLVGLVGLDVYRTRFERTASIIVFTSSVVIDAAYRGRNLTVRTGWRMLLREKLRRPWLPAYWLFDTFSYKSYVLLPHYFVHYWPRRERATPSTTTRFIDHLARQRYSEDWIPKLGIVRRSGSKRLRPTTAPIDDHALADPDIAFYQRVNPGHADGDMLVCLAPLTLRNMLTAFVRGFFAARRRQER